MLFVSMQILNSKLAALLALGAGPVLSNKQMPTTGQIRVSLSYQKKLTVIIHGCRYIILFILPNSLNPIRLYLRSNVNVNVN